MKRLLPLTVTIVLFLAMAAFGAIRYDGFLSLQVFLNLLIDNAFLCVVAVGMTFVILSGGIDLSVGALIALTTIISATLLEAGWHPYAVMVTVLALGAPSGPITVPVTLTVGLAINAKSTLLRSSPARTTTTVASEEKAVPGKYTAP